MPDARLFSWVPLGVRAVTAIFSIVAIAVVVLYPIIGPPHPGVTTAGASSRLSRGLARSDRLRHPGQGRSSSLAGGGASGAATPIAPPPLSTSAPVAEKV